MASAAAAGPAVVSLLEQINASLVPGMQLLAWKMPVSAPVCEAPKQHALSRKAREAGSLPASGDTDSPARHRNLFHGDLDHHSFPQDFVFVRDVGDIASSSPRRTSKTSSRQSQEVNPTIAQRAPSSVAFLGAQCVGCVEMFPLR